MNVTGAGEEDKFCQEDKTPTLPFVNLQRPLDIDYLISHHGFNMNI